MRILIVSDAWYPQMNGVVRTLDHVRRELVRAGDEVQLVHPAEFPGLACPSYPEIRLAILPGRALRARVEAFRPEAIHIATEGPLGISARRLCLSRGWPFTTAFHTRFPDYIRMRWGIPSAVTFAWLRGFHRPAARVLAATERLRLELEQRGFRNAARWTRGVDSRLFHPARRIELGLPRPVQLYVGRLAPEKDLPAFLGLDTPGTKLVVGSGPESGRLQRAFPRAVFAGALQGEALARVYASADVFVFPSRTDTFGLVLLEALAAGLPVAARPVAGPLDVLTEPGIGVLDEDLGAATRAALVLDRAACRAFALKHSWSACARSLRAALAPIHPRLRDLAAARAAPTREAS